MTALCLVMLAACGQSGPLFLPEEPVQQSQESDETQDEEDDGTTP